MYMCLTDIVWCILAALCTLSILEEGTSAKLTLQTHCKAFWWGSIIHHIKLHSEKKINTYLFQIAFPPHKENNQYISKNKVKTRITNCLRYILKIKWQDKITDKELARRTHQHSIGEIIEKRTWVWIGHTLRKETAEDHEWNHEGLGKPESPKSSQRRSVTEEMTTFGTTAKYMKKGFTVKQCVRCFVKRMTQLCWPCQQRFVKTLDPATCFPQGDIM